MSRPLRHPLCDHFLGWQCRVRQHAVRHAQGRPTSGMRPLVRLPDSDSGAEINVLVLRSEPAEHTARFRFIVQRTNDPAERLAEGMKELSAAYYQRPHEFSDVMTALFAVDSDFAARLAGAGQCELLFEQFSQRYRLPCAVASLDDDQAAFQATYWHNAMFNPALPGRVRVLSFQPDWESGSATPPIGPGR